MCVTETEHFATSADTFDVLMPPVQWRQNYNKRKSTYRNGFTVKIWCAFFAGQDTFKVFLRIQTHIFSPFFFQCCKLLMLWSEMGEYEEKPKWSCIMTCKRQPGLLGYLTEDYRVESCKEHWCFRVKESMKGSKHPQYVCSNKSFKR